MTMKKLGCMLALFNSSLLGVVVLFLIQDQVHVSINRKEKCNNTWNSDVIL